MREYHYFDGTVIKVGDRIRSSGRPGYVDEIFQPGTQDGADHSCPEGGILIIEDWDGVQSPLVLGLPDGEYWEDIEFVARAEGK